MADTELEALSALAAASVAGTDVMYIVDVSAGTAHKIDMDVLTSYFESRARQHNAAVANQTIGTSDVYVANSFIPIPMNPAGGNRLQAKTKFKYEFIITKGAAGTGTPVVQVRLGTAGTTADTSRLTFTFPAANTAAADEMKLTIHGTFRSVGSGTAAVIEGGMSIEHRLTTTGFGGTGQGANIFVNTLSAGFDSTVADLGIGVSMNGSTGASWTLRQGWGLLENLA